MGQDLGIITKFGAWQMVPAWNNQVVMEGCGWGRTSVEWGRYSHLEQGPSILLLSVCIILVHFLGGCGV